MKTLIRVVTVLCCLCLITPQFPSGQLYASEVSVSKSKKKKSAGKSRVGKQKNSSKGAARCFEGQLIYVVNSLHDWKVRKFSSGQAYNGESLLAITVKGDFIDIFDKSLQKHSVWNPLKQKGYVYSEVSGEGVELTKEQWEQMFAVIKNNNDKSKFDYRYEFAADAAPQMSGGDKCVVYKGQRTIAEKGDSPFDRTEIEMWYSDRYSVSPVCRYAFWGIEPHGLLKKGIISAHSHVSVLGNMKSQIDYELKDVVERRVADAEFALPSAIDFKPISDVGKMNGFYKRLTKALKKNKLYPKTQKAKEVKQAMSENWAFAEDWDSRSLAKPKKQMSIGDLGMQILNTIGSIASVWTPKSDEQTSSPDDLGHDSESAAAGNNPPDMADSYYIPERIEYCERNLKEAQEYINKKAMSKSRTPKKTHKVTVNSIPTTGPYPHARSKDQISVGVWREIAENSKKSIKFLRGYAMRNHTDYIPKSEWENHIERQEKNHKENFERRKKARKVRSDLKSSDRYNQYVEMLSNASFVREVRGECNYSIEWVKSCQDKMKELRRKNPKINKSPWEDWDGYSAEPN